MTIKIKNTRISCMIERKELHELAEIAKEKKVSVSWVIREAVTEYLNKNSNNVKND